MCSLSWLGVRPFCGARTPVLKQWLAGLWWVLVSPQYCVVGLEGLTSRQELHDEVQVHLILEAVEHFDHPQAICLYQNVPLSTDMTNLTNTQVQRFPTDVQQTQQQHPSVCFAASPVLSPACQLCGGSSWHRHDRCLSSAPDEPGGKHNNAHTNLTEAWSMGQWHFKKVLKNSHIKSNKKNVYVRFDWYVVDFSHRIFGGADRKAELCAVVFT